jgi:uncharacterized membrane protein YjjP (DUF1212 family)
VQDTALMLHTLLELGESMLADGADVRRVEQTLTRMGLAYGAVRMDVFVITSSIVLTMCFPDETSVTQTRRIEKSAVTDFRKLEAINAISRSYCEKPFPVQELADRLHLAKRCRPARWKLFAGSCLGAGALTVFFGGAGADGLAAAVFALALCLLQMYLPLICKNKVLFNFLAAFCVGSLISLACRALPALHGDKIIIGDIMLLIPGLAFTNAVKDIFIGDTISGVMRLIETILWAAALAAGGVTDADIYWPFDGAARLRRLCADLQCAQTAAAAGSAGRGAVLGCLSAGRMRDGICLFAVLHGQRCDGGLVGGARADKENACAAVPHHRPHSARARRDTLLCHERARPAGLGAGAALRLPGQRVCARHCGGREPDAEPA